MHSVLTVEAHAPSIDRAITYTVLVPDVGPGPYQVLYQLHGYSDDHRAWLYKSNLLRYVDGMPLVVVMPSGENSYYIDAFEHVVVDDIPAQLARGFNVRKDRAAIGGLSMGGYGAIRLGMLHPGRYASVYAHSSRILRDVHKIARRADRAKLPAIAFDCGTEDHLLDDSRKLHALFDELGIAHEYREHAGAHDWNYWDRHVPAALQHHARVLGL